MDLKRAYEILGVTYKAPIEEVEEQFFILIKSHKTQLETNVDSQNLINIDEVNEAYGTIKEYFEKLEKEKRQQDAPQKSAFRKKLEHILYYYKFHIIAGIFILVVTVVITLSTIEQRQQQAIIDSLPPADLTINIYGQFRNIEKDTLEDNILTMFPEWERVEIKVTTSPIEINSQFDVGEQQISVIELMHDESDVFIVDAFHFSTLIERDIFLPLTFLNENIINDTDNEELFYASIDNEIGEALYGLDITNHPIFIDSNMDPTNRNVVTFHARGNEQENAKKFIETLMN
ncbi:hypothetical protein [Evansella cellulosilytica]|uniref:J domain-containing protein n=1 Tax=Evansella cellulosilytica (strain ATCC 21833 / DSM 2522 / FERM P-1141 / JCM 9156 / N-4) TaxID=649639 RepID=E6TQM8_EVAC2|nr:hypothetical protein [Evansella cellulosilytica]ADU30539.1 hypothetical protein Bcell_2279 [Evansella cellulosilytica DSM 2522]